MENHNLVPYFPMTPIWITLSQDTSLNEGAYSTTEMRRRYPKDNEGVKDEWRALVKHHADINDMIIRHERELKQLKQQELGWDFDCITLKTWVLWVVVSLFNSLSLPRLLISF